MTTLTLGSTTSVPARRPRRRNPQTTLELLVQLEKRYPHFNREDLLGEYREQMLDPKNQDLNLSAIDTSFSLNFGRLHSKKTRKSPAERAAHQAKIAAVIENARDTITKYVVEVGFWDYPMPNGKRLHECTVKEAKLLKPKIGGLLRIIDNLRGKPTDIIGKIYTKAQLKKLSS
jgi:hypothetical protein